MRAKGWTTFKLHGNQYQIGLPDLLALHPQHGLRWIETKAPGGKLRQSQMETFATFSENGQKVYVLENDKDYSKLFKAENWRNYI